MGYKVTFATGQSIIFDNEPTQADIDEAESSLGISSKEKTTALENIGISLGQAGSTVAKGIGLLAGGAASLVDTELSDKIFAKTDEIAKSTQDYWTPKDKEQSFAGKLGGMVATLPMQIAAMPFSPADAGMTMIQQGETTDAAQSGALIDTLGNVAGIAMPAALGKSLLTKTATGAAGNALQDVATRMGIQSVAEKEETKKEPKKEAKKEKEDKDEDKEDEKDLEKKKEEESTKRKIKYKVDGVDVEEEVS